MQEPKDVREMNIEPEIYEELKKITKIGWCVADHDL
jgi:hypothetical protein